MRFKVVKKVFKMHQIVDLLWPPHPIRRVITVQKGSKNFLVIKNTHATHEREEERRWPPINFFSKEIFSFELLFAPLMWVGDIWWVLFQPRADQICHAWDLYLKWLMKIRDVLKVCAYVHAVSLWLFLMSCHHLNSLKSKVCVGMARCDHDRVCWKACMASN